MIGALLFPAALSAEGPFRFATTPGKLSKDIRPRSYEISITPDIEKHSFTGSEIVEIDLRKPTNSITLNAKELTVSTAELVDGSARENRRARISPKPADQTITLRFGEKLAPGTHRIALTFLGKINEAGQGLHFAQYHDEGSAAKKTMLATQMEPADARRLFPSWDEPSFRAKFRMSVTLPAAVTAVSNMPIESEKIVGAQKEVHFAETPFMATYLVVLCVGELESIHDEVDGVNIGVVATKGKAEQGRYALESAQKIVHYYNEYFGEKFPLPKLDLIALPAGFSGAMENWGGITFFESILLYDPAKSSEQTKQNIFGVVAHEIAHQWFGDLVTMAWWDNLWLNEGFASWMGTKCTDHFNPQWQIWLRANAAKQRAMSTDALSSTHPIQQPIRTESEADSAFDEITYQKGQSFLRMLESYLGEENFRGGIRSYIQAHKYSNATTADLWGALGDASKKPVDAVAASWTEQPGLPLVVLKSADGSVNAQQETFTVHQQNPKTLEWKIPLTFRDVATATGTPASVFLLDARSAVLPDVRADETVKLNLDGIGYYRVQYDPPLFTRLLAAAGKFSEADKVNLVSDSWALVRADRGKMADYFAVLDAVRDDHGLALTEQINSTIAFIDGLCLKAPQRPAFQTYARTLLEPALARVGWDAQPGEEVATGLLRVALISRLGAVGDDKVIDEARNRFTKFLADPNSLAPNLRPPVLDIVGRYADDATWQKLHQLGREAKSTEQKVEIYRAMADAIAPELAAKNLALAVSDEVPPNLGVEMVIDVAHGGEQPEMAFEFAKEHRKELDAKLDSVARVYFVPGIMRGFADSARASELEEYMRKNYPDAAMAEVNKAAEEIRSRAELKARVLPQIAQFVREQTPVRHD
ncbi:MAG: M1 family metallopeptidase [Chthoniobacterales bacterium]